ncbi:MAG: AraC family transcriptional regulator [Propionivibrio sp.]
MQPDLEVIQIGSNETFRVWEHGYPCSTVRWHFHPEYEVHQVVATTGRYFVGDFIGSFAPGNLVLTGPNLPHNWISDVPSDIAVPLRNRVLQFSDQVLRAVMAIIPELNDLSELLGRSRSGIRFSTTAEREVEPLLAELVHASGIRRIELFVGIMGAMSRDSDARLLTSINYTPDPSGYMSAGLNKVLAYINDHLTASFSESDLADIAGLSRSAFSRGFSRHTGLSLVRYVNRLRINLACQMLMSEDDMRVTEICFACGFNNVSNFNRQFATFKGISPTRFRHLLLRRPFVENADRIPRAA